MGIFELLKTKKGQPAAEIAEIEAALTRLRAERNTVNALVENHAPRRAEMLLSDASDAAILKFDQDAELARVRLERLEIAELELVDRLDCARDSVARQKSAAERESAASKIETIAVRLERAIGEVASISEELRAALPSCLDLREYREFWGDAGALSHDAVVRACVGEGLFSAAPQLFNSVGRESPGLFFERHLTLFCRRHDGSLSALFPSGSDAWNPLPLSGAIEANVVSPLRQSAALIRAGETPADAPATPTPALRQIPEAAE